MENQLELSWDLGRFSTHGFHRCAIGCHRGNFGGGGTAAIAGALAVGAGTESALWLGNFHGEKPWYTLWGG